MEIILLAGKSGSGKGTTADLIKEYYTYEKKTTVITEFSKYLKEYAKEIISWDGSTNTKPRKFLQDIGYTIRHELFDENFLINRMIEDIKVYEKYADVVVIADVRLPHEIEIIKEKFDNVKSFLIINQFQESLLSVDEQIHETEIALEDYNNFDKTIINETKEKLREDVFKILEEGKNNEN